MRPPVPSRSAHFHRTVSRDPNQRVVRYRPFVKWPRGIGYGGTRGNLTRNYDSPGKTRRQDILPKRATAHKREQAQLWHDPAGCGTVPRPCHTARPKVSVHLHASHHAIAVRGASPPSTPSVMCQSAEENRHWSG